MRVLQIKILLSCSVEAYFTGEKRLCPVPLRNLNNKWTDIGHQQDNYHSMIMITPGNPPSSHM